MIYLEPLERIRCEYKISIITTILPGLNGDRTPTRSPQALSSKRLAPNTHTLR